MNFYKVIQYATTKKGEEYMGSNPDVPWGCERIEKEVLDKFFVRYYEECIAKATTPRVSQRTGKILPTRSRNVLDDNGDIVPYKKWIQMDQIQNLYKNPYRQNHDFFFYVTRGYLKNSKVFDDLSKEETKREDTEWLTECGYYRRFLLENKCMTIDMMPDPNANKYYVFNGERFLRTGPWISFENNWSSIIQTKLFKFLDNKKGS